MGRDLARFESNERVDLQDFKQVADTTPQDQVRQIGAEFLGNPVRTGAQSFIIDGFSIDNPTGEQVEVTLGRAILAQREDGQVFNGQLTSEGELTRIIDVAGFAAATYGIYIRFEYVDGDTQGRAFWNPQGTGSEFAQNISTRRVANWSLRIEIASPGAEWFKIGEVDVAAGVITATTGLRDSRELYFEGNRDFQVDIGGGSAVLGTQYQSGWSSDGGGLSTDRSSDRDANGVTDLRTMLGALKQCVEDIKGRGLRRWWERDIGGMNVGFDLDPTASAVGVGDPDFLIDYNSGNPRIYFDDIDNSSGLRSFQSFNRGTRRYFLFIDAAQEMQLDVDGVVFRKGMVVGDNSITPIDDTLILGDADFYLDLNSGNPVIAFDDADMRITAVRGSDQMDFRINGSTYFTLADEQARILATNTSAALNVQNDGGGLVASFFTSAAPTRGLIQLDECTEPSSPSSGDVWSDEDLERQLVIDTGTRNERIPLLTSASQGLEIDSVSGLTNIDAITLNAATLKVGSVLRVRAVVLARNTSGSNKDLTQIRLKLDSAYVTILAPTPMTIADTEFGLVNIEAEILITADGAAGTWQSMNHVIGDDIASTTTNIPYSTAGHGGTSQSAGSIDTTGTVQVLLEASMDNDPDFSIQALFFNAERL